MFEFEVYPSPVTKERDDQIALIGSKKPRWLSLRKLKDEYEEKESNDYSRGSSTRITLVVIFLFLNLRSMGLHNRGSVIIF